MIGRLKGLLAGTENKRLRAELAEARAQVQNQRRQIDPSGLIWIFGTARVGSTWLMRMMGELDASWNEPLVGNLFGPFVGQSSDHQRRGDAFILGAEYERRGIRQFVLWSASERFPGAERVVIKEPNGSIGAPCLSAALPESRLILLVRDPRDVVASGLAAVKPGGWQAKVRERRGKPQEDAAEVVRSRADRYAKLMGASKQAYDSHEGPRAMLKYEALRQDTLRNMEQLYSGLDIEVDREALMLAVEKHDWENVPEEKKGPGKTRRKATPGGWREDLTEEQAREVERITAPIMNELGYVKAF